MKFIMCVMFIYIPLMVISQIGINTEHPLTLLHIDGAGDNNSLLLEKYQNDVVVDQDGNMGLGTILPSVKLDIHGDLRIVDGNEGMGKVLVSDNLGYASWRSPMLNRLASWSMSNDNITFGLSGLHLYGNSSVSDPSNIGLINQTNALQVPKGTFLIFVSFDIEDIYEFGSFKIIDSSDGNVIFESIYSVSLSGVANRVQFSLPTSIYISFTPIASGLTVHTQPPYTGSFKTVLQFLSLDL